MENMTAEKVPEGVTEGVRKGTEKIKKSKKKRAWKSDNLPHVFTVRADAEEYAELRQRAAATGWSLSRLMIEAALGKRIRTQEQAAAENEKVEEMIFQMRRIGINLNQITAALNAVKRGRETSVTEAKVEAAIADVESLICALRKQL